MSTIESDLLNHIESLVRAKYSFAKDIDIPEDNLKLNDLVKYGILLYSLANKLKDTRDRSYYQPTQLELLNIIDDCFSLRSLLQVNLGFELMQLFYEINEFIEVCLDYFDGIDIAILSLDQIRRYNYFAYERLPVGANLSRIKFFDLLFNTALNDISIREDFLTLRQDSKKLLLEIKREMHFILHTCARDNHRKLSPRFIGTIGSASSFVRAMSIILVFYEQHNPKVPLLIIFYLFAVLFWGDALSGLICSIPTSKKHSASSMFSSASVGALMFSVLVFLQKEHLGNRVALELGSFLGLPVLHYLVLQIPLVDKFIRTVIFPSESYFYPRRYPGRNIRRNLCDSSRVFAAYQVPVYVMLVAGIINYSGYNIYKNFWAFFFMQLGIIVVTQMAYSVRYYFSIRRYAVSAEENMLLPRFKLSSVSIEANQSLKDLQSEIIWMIVFSNFLLRGFINLDLAVSSSLGRMLIGIFSCLTTVLLSPPLGTIVQREFFARQAPRSVHKNYLEFLSLNGSLMGFSGSTNQRISKLLSKGCRYPQGLAERVQQVSLAAQTGDLCIGFGDLNILFSVLMLQALTIISYYCLDIILYNLLNSTDSHRGSLPYVFIELAVNGVLVLAVIVGLILLLRPCAAPLFMVEMYGLPSRVGSAVLELYKTTKISSAWQAFKQPTFVKPPPVYYKALRTRMQNVINDRTEPPVQSLPMLERPRIVWPSISQDNIAVATPWVEVSPASLFV